jgi:hypothetical protein
VKERLKLQNVRTDHVMVQSALNYIIGAKIVNWKCRVLSGKTGPLPMVQVFHVVRPVVMVQVRVEPDLEPTLEFGPIGNTREDIKNSSLPIYSSGDAHKVSISLSESNIYRVSS